MLVFIIYKTFTNKYTLYVMTNIFFFYYFIVFFFNKVWVYNFIMQHLEGSMENFLNVNLL